MATITTPGPLEIIINGWPTRVEANQFIHHSDTLAQTPITNLADYEAAADAAGEDDVPAQVGDPGVGISVSGTKYNYTTTGDEFWSNAATDTVTPWDHPLNIQVGWLYSYNGKTYICIQAHTSQVDWAPDQVPALYNVVRSGIEWETGVEYFVDDTAEYLGVMYTTLQQHVSQTGWEPPNVPALWTEVV